MNDQEEFVQGLRGEAVGSVKREDGAWVWTCDCGDKGECGDETIATMTLYFHRRSGHQQILDVTMGDPVA